VDEEIMRQAGGGGKVFHMTSEEALAYAGAEDLASAAGQSGKKGRTSPSGQTGRKGRAGRTRRSAGADSSDLTTGSPSSAGSAEGTNGARAGLTRSAGPVGGTGFSSLAGGIGLTRGTGLTGGTGLSGFGGAGWSSPIGREVGGFSSEPPGLLRLTPDDLQDLAGAAAETWALFQREVREAMTEERAAYVRKLRVDRKYTWRSVARACSNAWGTDWGSNQIAGMSICEAAAEYSFEDYRQPPWN